MPWLPLERLVPLSSSGLAGATLDSPIMGLTERLGVLAGFQWTFVLALRLFLL